MYRYASLAVKNYSRMLKRRDFLFFFFFFFAGFVKEKKKRGIKKETCNFGKLKPGIQVLKYVKLFHKQFLDTHSFFIHEEVLTKGKPKDILNKSNPSHSLVTVS